MSDPGIVSGGGPLTKEGPDDGFFFGVLGGGELFSTGSGIVPAGLDAAVVVSPAVTAETGITVVFSGDASSTRVALVQRFAGLGFIVRLLGGTSADVPFTYLLVEPGN